jgi:hypothetical protein
MQRRDPQRRYPILLTLLAQSTVDVLDDVVALFDQAVSARESRADSAVTPISVRWRSTPMSPPKRSAPPWPSKTPLVDTADRTRHISAGQGYPLDSARTTTAP